MAIPYERIVAKPGQRYGKLVVLREAPRRRNYRMWLCRCDCGREKAFGQYDLTRGNSRSCKCKAFPGHGVLGTSEYFAWQNMWARCRNPKHPSYHNYGARGISVYEAWQDVAVFLAHIGPRPSPLHSLDRIDNNGNYEPGNVRWATASTQMNNIRRNLRARFKGKTQTVSEWAREYGLPRYMVDSRLRLGWPMKDIVTVPAYGHRQKPSR